MNFYVTWTLADWLVLGAVLGLLLNWLIPVIIDHLHKEFPF